MRSVPAGIFYGWWNVATGFVGMGFSYAMFTIFAFGVFVKPLADEFGWTRGELSFAITMTNFAVVLASPGLGFIIDKFGVRRILIPSVIMMGLTVASMALLSASLWHFYALYFLIPFLGAGTLPQSYSRTLIAWFERRRGIALGISLSGFGVGAMLVPVVAQLMIDSYGWRMAYAGFGAAVLLLSLPMVVFVLRENPAEMGLKPDGGPAQTSESGAAVLPGSSAPGGAGKNGMAPQAVGLSCREAARTRSFWLILISFMLVGIGITSIIAHLVPLLTDRGVAPTDAALYMSSLALGLIAGRLLAGFLMDYFFAPYVAACFLLGLIAGIVILASGTAGILVLVAALLVGMATGSEISEIAYICSRYFGPRAFGLIYGFMFSAFQLGSMAGSPLLGLYHDRAGDYVGALWIVAALVAIGAVLIALLGPYPDKFPNKGPDI